MEDLSRFDEPTLGVSNRQAKQMARKAKKVSVHQLGSGSAVARIDGRLVAFNEIDPKTLASLLSDEQRMEMLAKLNPELHQSVVAEQSRKQKLKTMSHQDERIFTVAHAVKNDPHCAFNAEIGIQLLADDDFAGLSGDAIVKHMKAGPMPPPPPTAEEMQDRMEAAQREVMLAALAETPNSAIDPTGSGGASASSADHSNGWAKATADANRRNGFK